MRLPGLLAAVATVAIFPISAVSATYATCGPYAIVGSIPARSSLWDYASINPATQRLYLSSAGVMALDLQTRKVVQQLVPGEMTHGVIPVGPGLAAVADATNNAVVIFSGTTGKIIGRVETGKPPTREGWHNPDALVFLPRTGLLIAVNGDSGTLVLVDIRTLHVVDTIAVGGKLEFAAADGAGKVFVNIETRNAIGVVDLRRHKLVKRVALAGCEDPTGLAYDKADALVMSVCTNGVAEFMNSATDAIVAAVKVGKGADAMLYDPVRHVAFTPNGDDGTLTIISVDGTRDIHVVQTLKTQPSARLGAVDIRTGKLYIPAAHYDLSAPPVRLPGLAPMPAVIPDSFQFLIVAPRDCSSAYGSASRNH